MVLVLFYFLELILCGGSKPSKSVPKILYFLYSYILRATPVDCPVGTLLLSVIGLRGLEGYCTVFLSPLDITPLRFLYHS